MAKRVFTPTVIKWLIGIGGGAGTIIGGIFLYLYLTGAIDVLGYSGDVSCAGTQLDPCYAYINFTVPDRPGTNEDIFIYPTNYDPWGRNTSFDFDPSVESWIIQRSWGAGWRTLPLDKSCTGTWCGLSSSKDTRKFSVAFREGRTYKIRIVAYKRNPNDIIKWSAFDVIDPYWLSVEVGDKVVKELCTPIVKTWTDEIKHYKTCTETFAKNGSTVEYKCLDHIEKIPHEQIECRKKGQVDVDGVIIQDNLRWCELIKDEVCCLANIDGGRYGNWDSPDVDKKCTKI